MNHRQHLNSGGFGKLSYRPPSEEGLVPSTIAFLLRQLPNWRDDPNRPDDESEKPLNSSLCDFLEVQTRSDTGLPMVRFKHEAPQAGQSTVDIGVHGVEPQTTIGVETYSIYRPFFVIECKRLPTPGGAGREKEYVSGFNSSGNPAGGIQRFKVGSHGADVLDAAIIGYIQRNTPKHWHKEINKWISELSNTTCSDGCVWSDAEQMDALETDAEKSAWRSCSTHARSESCRTDKVILHHLWVVMNNRPNSDSN